MSNPLILGANNAVTALAGAISSGAVSLTVTTGTGALFPQPTGGNYFVITVVDAATGLLREIMHVTAVVGDVFTVVRAQENTIAQAYALNDPVANLWTIGQFNALQQTNQLGSAAYLTASDQIGGVSAIQPFAGGNPNGFVAGNASAGSVPPSMVWDTQDQIFWICVTTGNSASAVWIPLNQLQGTVWCGTSGGSANAQTLTPTIPITGYGPGLAISFTAGLTNTGAMTVNVSGKGNVSVYKDTPSGPAPLTGGEVVTGNIVAMRYDGTHFQLTATDLGTASLYNTGATVVPIAGNLEIASPFGATLTGASYSFIQADRGKSRKRSNAGSAMVDTLPVVATLADGWWVNVNNIDATANDTISPPAGTTLNGVLGGSIVLSPGEAARIGFDGSGFWVTAQPVSKLTASQYAYVNVLNDGQVIPPGAYEVDSSGGVFSLLLELSAVTGDNYTFKDFARTWGQFPVTLNGNGNTIQGTATWALDITGATDTQIAFSPSNWAYQ